MPERELLTESQRLSLHAPASDERGMVRHYMNRFFRRLAEGVFDEKDPIRRTHVLFGLFRRSHLLILGLFLRRQSCRAHGPRERKGGRPGLERSRSLSHLERHPEQHAAALARRGR